MQKEKRLILGLSILILLEFLILLALISNLPPSSNHYGIIQIVEGNSVFIKLDNNKIMIYKEGYYDHDPRTKVGTWVHITIKGSEVKTINEWFISQPPEANNEDIFQTK